MHQVPASNLEFFNLFAQLDTEYEELEIDSFGFESTQFVETALRITPSTVEFLTLFTDDKCK